MPAILLLALCSLPISANSQGVTPAFALHDGDRVTFYGDSITDQREYTEDVEEYVLTRFPAWDVSFHNAGVGGDKVTGGGAGPIDLRLDRDVFAWHPNIVTVMLGMNDFYYRPDQPGIYSTYTDGYRHLVDSLKKNDPGVRITLIEPSPYDDISRTSSGNNAVLLKYSAFVAELAQEQGAQVADFNTPVTDVLKGVYAASPTLAPQIIPDRVHPQQGGHWIMAESLLKSWHAPSLVTSVAIDGGVKPTADATNTAITDLTRAKGKINTKLNWTQTDKALPLPFPSPEVDPVLALVLRYSDVTAALDQETLKVSSLAAGSYVLLIDGRKIGSFTEAQLAAGINLSTMETPMLEQARLVAFDTERVNFLESQRFQIIRSSTTPEQLETAQALADAYPVAAARQRADAQPLTHHYELDLAAPATTGK
jgi:lysophospholipase L1-like esterase